MANQLIATTEIVYNAMSGLTVGRSYQMTLKSIDNEQVSNNGRKLSFALGTVKDKGKDVEVRCLIMKRNVDETPTFEEGALYSIVPARNGNFVNATLLTPEKSI
jgi:hypothetical protein